MNQNIAQRLQIIRRLMQRERLSAYIFPSTDAHGSEYVPHRWKGREWVTGFTGSAGTAVVTMNSAALWTDSRYFIQAEEQLRGTEIQLMRQGLAQTPTIAEWLQAQIVLPTTVSRPPQSTEVGIDGMCLSVADGRSLVAQLRNHGGFTFRTNFDLLQEAWTDRPDVPLQPVYIHPLEYAGEPAKQKLERIREALRHSHADGMLVSALDEVAWTLNLRGSDIDHNPVFVSYLLIRQRSATLFIDRRKVPDNVIAYLSRLGVEIQPYGEIRRQLAQYADYSILIDPAQTSIALLSALKGKHIVEQTSPIRLMKAVKNQTEIDGFKTAMLRDGIALVRLLRWLEQTVGNQPLTELSVCHKLEELKSDFAEYRGPSFGTISAYEQHGAIVHYEPTPQTDAPLETHGLLLLDCGSQYPEGTTDVTRTIPLGPITDEQRRIYTLVLKAHIQLELAVFPEGCSGTQIDALAREPLWREGLNFLHGTGHGVGSYLSVHEGPQQVRMNYVGAPLLEGMTITDEPGVYLEGRFGVRIENTLLTVAHRQTDFGRFLGMQPLTLCPIATEPLIKEWLTDEECSWLNAYHKTVVDVLSPRLSADEQQWLRAYVSR